MYCYKYNDIHGIGILKNVNNHKQVLKGIKTVFWLSLLRGLFPQPGNRFIAVVEKTHRHYRLIDLQE